MLALAKITTKDLNYVKTLKRPPIIIQRIMDVVLILFNEKLEVPLMASLKQKSNLNSSNQNFDLRLILKELGLHSQVGLWVSHSFHIRLFKSISVGLCTSIQ